MIAQSDPLYAHYVFDVVRGGLQDVYVWVGDPDVKIEKRWPSSNAIATSSSDEGLALKSILPLSWKAC